MEMRISAAHTTSTIQHASKSTYNAVFKEVNGYSTTTGTPILALSQIVPQSVLANPMRARAIYMARESALCTTFRFLAISIPSAMDITFTITSVRPRVAPQHRAHLPRQVH